MFRNMHSTSRRPSRTFSRTAAVEVLERRDMLAAGPRVVGVEVASTTWSPDFVSYLQGNDLDKRGYSVPLGSSSQSSALTWTNLDQIRIKFNTDVVLNAADLAITGINHKQYAIAAFTYDPSTDWATWTLATPIDSDRILLDLDANGARPVRDFGAHALDGEWINNSSVVSGNGTAGGDFEFRLNVQPADVDNSGSVTLFDHTSMLTKLGLSTADPGYSAKYDIDGNGMVDAGDLLVAVDRVFQALPTGSPAGMSNDAPTTTLFNLYKIDDAASDLAIALSYGFADAESGGSGLTYSVLSVDNPGILDSVAINPSSHGLVVNAASEVSGRVTIVVRATDAGGLFVDTPIKVDVNRENAAPILTLFRSESVGPGIRFYWGHVTDADDTLTDLVVYVYGDFFETFAAVDENGNFEFAVMLDDEAWGFEYAIACDLQSAWSNVREDAVQPT